MIKAGDMWLSLDRVTLAMFDSDGDLLLYFGAEHRVRIPKEKKANIAKVIAALDHADGCTPAAKTEAEGGETLYGVAPDGREEQKTVPPMPEVKSPSGKSGLERIREMGIDELIELVEANRGYICPPPLRGSKSCHREITCETCWREWLGSSADGDPDA